MRLGPRRPAPPRAALPGSADLADLMGGSSLATLGDGELLARFAVRGDEAAFEGLVGRHGAMVLGVCRRMLGAGVGSFGPDDAFQATFLVLVRRAGSIGRGDLIGPWLHAVAVRVCRQARARGHRRAGRERAGPLGELALRAAAAEPAADPLDRAETWALIDEAIARLPERDQHLIVLADVEGLSRPEVADRLGWTPNMVRGRLARARGRLRADLARRGCAPIGRDGAIGSESGGSEPVPMAFPWLAPPPTSLVAATTRAAALASNSLGRRFAATLAAGPAVSLAEGVSRMLVLTSWKLVGAGLVAAGSLLAGTAVGLIPQAPAPPPAPAPTPGQPGAIRPAAPPALPPDDASLAALLAERLKGVRLRYEAQNAFYEEGRITIDRLIDAAQHVMSVEQELAETPDQRRAAVQVYVNRLQRIYDRETRELEVGRATHADLTEAYDRLLEARILLARRTLVAPTTQPESPRLAELRQAQVTTARQVFRATQALYRDPPAKAARPSASDYVRDLKAWADLEIAQATTPEARTQALQAQIDQAKAGAAVATALQAIDKASSLDVDRMRAAVLDAQIQAEAAQTPLNTDRANKK